MAGSSYGVKRSAGGIGPRYKRRRMGMSTRVRPKGLNVSRFTRTFWAANWAFGTSTTAQFYRGIAPTFGDLPDYGQYANLFDTYKVKRVKVTILPRFGDCNINADNTSTPTIYNTQLYLTVAMNTTDLTIPTGTYNSATYNTMLERSESVRVYKLDKPITWSYKPNVLNSTTGGSAVIPCPWLSVTNNLQNLLGCYGFIHDNNFSFLNASGFSVDIMYTFEFECRGPR